MDVLLQLMRNTTYIPLLQVSTWLLSNLCRGKPPPTWDIISKAIPVITNLIHTQDVRILEDICWSLSYITDGDNIRIQEVVNSGVIPKLIDLLNYPSFSIQTPTLRTIGNIISGEDEHTQIMIDNHVLKYLYNLLNSPKSGIRKETCWAISNITATNVNQIQEVIKAEVFPLIIRLLGDPDYSTKKDAVWAIYNTTIKGTQDQIEYVVTKGCIPPLCRLLDFTTDNMTLIVILQSLEQILKVGLSKNPKSNPYVPIIELNGGLDALEKLQQHGNQEIYQKVVKILEDYFHATTEDNVIMGINVQNFNFQNI